MIDRTLSDTITRISKSFKVVLLTGMRQIGKSTLFEMLVNESRTYVSLDNLDIRLLAKTNPELFIQRYRPPVVIDEIQYAPELFTYIKIYVDSHRENGLFWLTGSQKFHLMQGVQESMAGRVAVLDMLGFSQKEIENRACDVKPFLPSCPDFTKRKTIVKQLQLLDLYKVIFTGSFPQLIINQGEGRDIFLKSYLQTYIERDVRDFHGITNNIKFYNFIRAVAVRTGNLLNYSDLSRDVDIDLRTAQTWLAILERSGVVKLLYPYYQNITKRIIKTPKVYFLDTGLCVYLAGIDSVQALEASYLTGSILETYAFCEILKSYWHNGLEPNIYFYRDGDQKEIDFLFETNGMLYPAEVKKTAIPTKQDAKNFDLLKKLQKPIGHGAVLCLKSDYFPLSENVTVVPVWDIA